MNMVATLGVLALWLCSLLSRVTCGALALEIEIIRGMHGKAQDWFRVPREACEGTRTIRWRCADYGALEYNTACYICSCPANKATFGYFDSRWQCIGNAQLRRTTGCGLLFPYQQQSSPVKVLSTGQGVLISLPQDRICRYQYAADTSLWTCSGNWTAANTIWGGSRYRLTSYPSSRGRYYHRLDVDRNGMGGTRLQGRVVRLNISCVRNGAPSLDGCLLLKERYQNTPRTCVMGKISPTTITTIITSSPVPRSPTTATDQENGTNTPTTTEGGNDTRPIYPTIPVQPPTQGDQASSFGHNELSIIIGAGAGGGGLALVIFIACTVCWWRRKQRQSVIMYGTALYNNSGLQENGSAQIYDDAQYCPQISPKTDSTLSHSNPSYGLGKDMSIQMTVPRSECGSSSSPSVIPLTPPCDDVVSYSRQDRLHSDDSLFVDMDPDSNGVAMPVIYENLKNQSIRSESRPDSQPFYAVLEDPEPERLRRTRFTKAQQDERQPLHSAHPSINNTSQLNSSGNTPRNDPNSVIQCGITDDEIVYAISPVNQTNDPRDQRFRFPSQTQRSNRYTKNPTPSSGGANTPKQAGLKAAPSMRKSKKESKTNRGYSDSEEPRHVPQQSSKVPYTTGSPPVYDEAYHYVPMQDGAAFPHEGITASPGDNTYQELGPKREVENSSDYQQLTPREERNSTKARIYTTKAYVKPKPPQVKPKPKATK